MRRILSLLVLSALVLLLVLPAQAQPVPRLLSYQGVLFNSGAPVTKATSVTFAFFEDAACATAFPASGAWSQTLSVTPDAAGVFSVLLGSDDPANAAFFAFAFDRLLYLKTSVGGTQVACQGLAAAPYALGLYGLRVEPETATEGPNVIGGWSGNSVGAGVEGATISGGGDPDLGGSPRPNEVLADYGTVGGGLGNTASDIYATVGGGSSNTASDTYATLGGGLGNTASEYASTVGGGQDNTASGGYDTVGGGLDNTTIDTYATVGGGQSNTAGEYATVGGGLGNSAIEYASTVGGGDTNTASGSRATVGGGWFNTASGSRATVGGGQDNTASALNATVGGGRGNTASGQRATVGGGLSNTASGSRATVGGGAGNTASGNRATVPGGFYNQAGGEYSFAAGRRAKVRDAATVGGGDLDGDQGTFLWADATNTNADFTSTGPNQFRVRAVGGTTFFSNTAATVGVSLAAGGNTWASVSDSTRKERFLAADGERFLRAISRMRLGSWNYRGQDPARFRHYGPMAQDFFAAFGQDGVGVIGTDTTLATGDVDGVLFIAVQALAARTAALDEALATIDKQQAMIDGQQARIDAQQVMIDGQQARLAALEAEQAQGAALAQRVAALEALLAGSAGEAGAGLAGGRPD